MGNNVYFISDLHLGAPYLADARTNELRVVNFLRHIKDDVAELYMLGDVLDYWYEYKKVVPRGYTRFFGALADLADAGVKIYWLTGNHDVWLFDYLATEVGITVLNHVQEREIMGHRFLLSHGDDVGYQPRGYKAIKAVFYNKFAQFLYASVHPRWTVALAEHWSKHSRNSHRRRAQKDPQAMQQLMEHYAQNIVDFTNQYEPSHPDVDFYLYGHLHLARLVNTANGKQIAFLGDWVSNATYAKFDGNKLTLGEFGIKE